MTRDGWNRLHTEVLAMDAIYFRSPKIQFEEAKIVRELKKCYASFKPNNDEMSFSSSIGQPQPQQQQQNSNERPPHYPALATGNWGCGAFNGDRQLKCNTNLSKS